MYESQNLRSSNHFGRPIRSTSNRKTTRKSPTNGRTSRRGIVAGCILQQDCTSRAAKERASFVCAFVCVSLWAAEAGDRLWGQCAALTRSSRSWSWRRWWYMVWIVGKMVCFKFRCSGGYNFSIQDMIDTNSEMLHDRLLCVFRVLISKNVSTNYRFAQFGIFININEYLLKIIAYKELSVFIYKDWKYRYVKTPDIWFSEA